jgi:anti-anti-sigma factor
VKLDVGIHIAAGEFVVALAGELDMAETETLRHVIDQAFEVTTGEVVIDLANLRSRTSAGTCAERSSTDRAGPGE